jgi:hypothetical protein
MAVSRALCPVPKGSATFEVRKLVESGTSHSRKVFRSAFDRVPRRVRAAEVHVCLCVCFHVHSITVNERSTLDQLVEAGEVAVELAIGQCFLFRFLKRPPSIGC